MTQGGREGEPFGIPQDPYPRGITPEIRAEVDGYMAQGKPLEVGVALFIVSNDSDAIRDVLLDRDEILSRQPLVQVNMMLTAVAPAVCFIKLSMALLLSAGEAIPSKITDTQVFEAHTAFLNLMAEGITPEQELTNEVVDQFKITLQVLSLLKENKRMKFPKRRSLFMKAIDTYTDAECDKFAHGLQEHPTISNNLQDALRQGRRRFLEIYEDMRRPLPKISEL